MTRPLPEGVRAVAYALMATEAYLWSTSRIPDVTCEVCVRDTTGAPLCPQCQAHAQATVPLADLVASLVYAPYFTQSYHLVKNYKSDNPGPSLPQKMASLMAVGLRGHLDCYRAISGSRDTTWAVVPSLRRPGQDHPLRRAVLTFARADRETRLTAAPGVADPRALDPAHFGVPTDQQLPDSVILVEDSWVGGGHAQSAASALKLAGVRHVGVFNVARVLDPRWGPTAEFIRHQRAQATFDPTRCPWTDGVCP